MMILAPFIIFIASFITFVGVPLSENFLISNFNVGVLYILAFCWSYWNNISRMGIKQ